jgi:hypothetical protein
MLSVPEVLMPMSCGSFESQLKHMRAGYLLLVKHWSFGEEERKRWWEEKFFICAPQAARERHLGI